MVAVVVTVADADARRLVGAEGVGRERKAGPGAAGPWSCRLKGDADLVFDGGRQGRVCVSCSRSEGDFDAARLKLEE